MIGVDSSESILLLKRAFKHMHCAVTVSSDVLGAECVSTMAWPFGTLKNTMFHQGTEIRQLEFAQKMIQSDTHQGRLEYFKDILDEEYRASIAKKSLKNL